jgi:hypothetical protein
MDLFQVRSRNQTRQSVYWHYFVAMHKPVDPCKEQELLTFAA